MSQQQNNKIALRQPDIEIDVVKWSEVAFKCAREELHTAEEIANYMQISYAEAVSMLMDHRFSTFVNNMMVAIAKHEFNVKVIPRLLKIAKTEIDPEISIKAAKELGEILGYKSKDGKSPANVHIHLEGMLKELKNKNDVIDVDVSFPGLD